MLAGADNEVKKDADKVLNKEEETDNADKKNTDTCLAVLTEKPRLRSEIGNQLAAKSKKEGLLPVGAVVYVEESLGSSMVKISLRSLGDFDTTLASKQHGGGGHKNASSFVTTKTSYLSWKV